MADYKNKIKEYLKSEMFIINIVCFLTIGTSATLLLISEIKKVYYINARDSILLIIICLAIWFMEKQQEEKNKNRE